MVERMAWYRRRMFLLRGLQWFFPRPGVGSMLRGAGRGGLKRQEERSCCNFGQHLHMIFS